MSNPLANLKKTQKNNFLPGNRPMPFRNPYYSEDESKLLEEITGGMASSRVKSQDPFVSGLPKIKKSTSATLKALAFLQEQLLHRQTMTLCPQ